MNAFVQAALVFVLVALLTVAVWLCLGWLASLALGAAGYHFPVWALSAGLFVLYVATGGKGLAP